jgi:predicted enzyme related to lactoylglutathione lyase
MVYFAVANVDDAANKAVSLGGTLLAPGMDIPGIGRFATIQNPQGAVFSIFSGV